MDPSSQSKTPPDEYVPWTPPGAPPVVRLRDAAHPLALIAAGALVVALVVGWMARSSQPPDVAPVPSVVPAGTSGLPASLLVDSEPIGASVWVNGDSVGVSPTWLESVEPGVVEVAVRSGERSLDTTLALRSGQDKSVLLRFAPSSPEPVVQRQEIAPRPGGRANLPETGSVATPPPAPSTAPPARPTERSSPAPTPSRVEAPSPPAGSRTGRLQLTTEPAGVAVWIDRKKVGTTPLTLDGLAVGEKVVELRAQGYETERLRLEVAAGELVSETVALREHPGLVTVASLDGSKVFVDGSLEGTTGRDPVRLSLLAGEYAVRVVYPDGSDERRDVTVKSGTTLRLSFNGPPRAEGEDTPRRRTGW